jgi:PPOX class probable F420-dependent enzyme
MSDTAGPSTEPGSVRPYGSGVKQRNQVEMTAAEIAAFLAERHTLSIATLNRDGSIHMVAMWYGFLEGEIAFTSKAKAQKVVNLRRNPAITVMVEEGDDYDELVGVSIQGTAEIVEDPERMHAAGVSVFERHTGPYVEERNRRHVDSLLHKRVVIKVLPDKVVSWDHRKL